MVNPLVKKGDKVVLKEGRNGQHKNWVGVLAEVIQGTTNQTGGYIYVKAVNGIPAGQNTFYNNGPADVYVLADRKEQAKYLRIKLKDMRKEMTAMKTEIEFLEKYEDEEEYVAEKIDLLLKTKGKKAKAEILRELKKTNLI